MRQHGSGARIGGPKTRVSENAPQCNGSLQCGIAARLNLWRRVEGNGDDRGQAIAAARTAGYRPSSKQPSSGDQDAHPTDPDRPSRRADRPFGLLEHSRQKHDLRPPGRIARGHPNSAELIGTPAFLGEGGVQLRDGYSVSSHLIANRHHRNASYRSEFGPFAKNPELWAECPICKCQ